MQCKYKINTFIRALTIYVTMITINPNWGYLVDLFAISPTRKMTLFGAIFEVNSSIYKVWNLFENFGEKDTVGFS